MIIKSKNLELIYFLLVVVALVLDIVLITVTGQNIKIIFSEGIICLLLAFLAFILILRKIEFLGGVCDKVLLFIFFVIGLFFVLKAL